jgi:hypothetical protein
MTTTKAPRIKTMELFAFVEIIKGHIEFSGSYDPDNPHCNVELHRGNEDASLVEHGHLSCFGRSENVDFDEALQDLAETISGKQIWFGKVGYNVPKLTHTKGNRG